MLRKWLLSFLFPFLLLFSQQALFAHEISHLGDASPTSQDQAPHTAGFCSQCLAIGGLGSALPSTHSSFPAGIASPLTETRITLVKYVSLLNAYTSRAPPAAQSTFSR